MVGKGEPVCFKLMVARGDGGGGFGRECVGRRPCMLLDLSESPVGTVRYGLATHTA